MKRGTPHHPKVDDLMDALCVRRYEACGILELLWHFASVHARQGDIGRHSNARIARAVDWGGDPGLFIDRLVKIGWLEKHGKCRLIIHHWEEHCDRHLRFSLKRDGLEFITSDPATTKKSGDMLVALPRHKAPQSATPEPEPEPEPDKKKDPPTPRKRRVPLFFLELVEEHPALKTAAFTTTWHDWVEFRAEIKHTLTRSTAMRQLKKFARMGVDKAVAMMEHTMCQGWWGLREPDQAEIPNEDATHEEIIRRDAADAARRQK